MEFQFGGYGGVDWTFGLGMSTFIVFLVLLIILALIIFTIFLKIALAITDAKHTDFGEVFVTAIFCVLVGWIPCIGCLLCGAVIGSRHDTGFVIGVVVYILAILIGYVLTFFITMAIVGAVFGVNAAIPFLF